MLRSSFECRLVLERLAKQWPRSPGGSRETNQRVHRQPGGSAPRLRAGAATRVPPRRGRAAHLLRAAEIGGERSNENGGAERGAGRANTSAAGGREEESKHLRAESPARKQSQTGDRK